MFLPSEKGPQMLLVRSEVVAFELIDVHLADADEVATFAVPKRRNEHLTGRWLLQQALTQWGLDASLLMVNRTKHRAPFLVHIPGIWKNTPLPSISIGHSNGWAYVALIEPGWRIGIDAEPSERGIQENAFDLMSKGAELNALRVNPDAAIQLWVAKEAVQKTIGKGMHLNPRDIKIPIGVSRAIIPIGKLKIQLETWTFREAEIAIAYHQGSIDTHTAEDALLDVTRAAMAEGDWGVGCNTTRNNV